MDFSDRLPSLQDLCAKITDTTGLATRVVIDRTIPELPGPRGIIAFEVLPDAPVMLESFRDNTIDIASAVPGDLTLFDAAIVSLEALGGKPRHPVGEDLSSQFARPVSVKKIVDNQRDQRQVMWAIVGLHLVLLPLYILILAVVFVPLILIAIIAGWSALVIDEVKQRLRRRPTD